MNKTQRFTTLSHTYFCTYCRNQYFSIFHMRKNLGATVCVGFDINACVIIFLFIKLLSKVVLK